MNHAVRNHFIPSRSGFVKEVNTLKGMALVDFGDKDSAGNPLPVWCLLSALDKVRH